MGVDDLLGTFLEGLPAGSSPDAEEREGLRASLAALAAAAQRAWPGVALPIGPFGAFLAARLPAGPSVLEGLRGLRSADLYLAWACLQGDEAALRAFLDLGRSVVGAALAGLDPSGGLAEEVLQGLSRRLLAGEAGEGKKLEQYRGQAGLAAFVRVAAVRAALNLRRGQRRECALEEDLLLALVSEGDPELAYLKQLYRQEFKLEFQRVLAGLSARERNLLAHQIVDGLTLEQIGTLYRVNRSTVCRWLQAVRDRLRQETRAGLAARLDLDPQDVDSILQIVLSRIDTSLARVLAAGDGEADRPL